MKEMLMWDKYDNKYRTVVDVEEVKQLQAELDKKDKIINEMAKEIHRNNIFDCDYKHFKDNKCKLKYPDVPNEYKCTQCIIDYFTKKAEGK